MLVKPELILACKLLDSFYAQNSSVYPPPKSSPKVRVYSPEVMKVAAAWLRKAVRRMSKCVNVA